MIGGEEEAREDSGWVRLVEGDGGLRQVWVRSEGES